MAQRSDTDIVLQAVNNIYAAKNASDRAVSLMASVATEALRIAREERIAALDAGGHAEALRDMGKLVTVWGREDIEARLREQGGYDPAREAEIVDAAWGRIKTFLSGASGQEDEDYISETLGTLISERQAAA